MLIEINAEFQMKKAEVAEVMSLVRSVDDIGEMLVIQVLFESLVEQSENYAKKIDISS